MKRFTAIATLFAVLGATAIIQAQDFSWNQTTSSIWGTPTNWTPNSPAGGPDAPGLFVLINTNITVGNTITLFNTGDPGDNIKTVGRLDIGDAVTSSNFTIATGSGGGVLDFNGNGGNAQLNNLSTSNNNTISAPVSLSSSLDVNNASPNALTISGVVSGSGNLSNLSGTLALTAVNTYTGNTTISAGTISVDGDATLGNGGGTLTLSGGTLNVSADRGTANVIANNITLTANSTISTSSAATSVTSVFTGTLSGTAGTLTFNNSGADGAGDTFNVRFSGGSFTTSRPIVLTSAIGQVVLNDFNTTGTTHQFDGAISGNGGFNRSASVAGSGGATVFTAANTYTGSTTIAQGTLQLGNGGTTGSLSTSSAINLSTSNGTFGINRSNAVTQGTDFSGAAIAGAGKFLQAGTGTTTLNIANTYSGGTTISGGTLVVTINGGLGTGNVSLTAAAVTLTLQGVGNNIADTATLNIGFTNDVVNLNYAGTDTIAALVINGTSEAPGVYGSAASGAANIRPELFGTGTLTVAVPEPATYVLIGLGVLVCGQQFLRRKKA